MTMQPYTIHVGDSLHVLATFADSSVDSIVTDPPYGLGKQPDALAMLRDWLDTGHHDVKGSGFMGKAWDSFVPQPALWKECLRVLKPGGHLLAFAGTRTMDLMALGLRIAGFELRDAIGHAHDGGGAPLLAWCYGSGFPKSRDVSKAIDSEAGAVREVIGKSRYSQPAALENGGGVLRRGIGENCVGDNNRFTPNITAPATPAAARWQGWGTALKPAWEPIILARKPLVGTVAANVAKYGTGALNVDGCRIRRSDDDTSGWSKTGSCASENRSMSGANYEREAKPDDPARWPANLVHDGSPEVLAEFPADAESGSAARFFYCGKATREDREAGLLGADSRVTDDGRTVPADNAYQRGKTLRTNSHPTVKPTELMRWLVRLVTPPGGVVLDPFMGSGSTGKAARIEGFRFIGIELSEEYAAIARARIAEAEGPLFSQ